MKFGEITCKCGQLFYFESATDEVECVGCSAQHNVSMFPTKEDIEIVDEAIDEDITVEEKLEEIASSTS